MKLMEHLLLHCEQIQLSKLLLITKDITTKLRKGQPGYIPIRYSTNNDSTKRLLFQTPKMFAPFGASCYNKNEIVQSGKFPNYYVLLSLEDNSKINPINKFLRELDNFICNEFSKDFKILKLLGVKLINKKTQKQKTIEEIQEDLENNRYVSIIREGKQKTDGSFFPSLFKCRTYRDTKSHKIETICEVNHELIEFSDDNIEQIFQKCMYCRCIIEISHVWVVGGRFGVVLKLMRCKLYPSIKSKISFLPNSDDDDHDDDIEKKQNNDTAAAAAAAIADDDDDAEDVSSSCFE